MAWTERYVRTDAAGGADGTNDTTSATTGAWTLAEAVTNEVAGMRINIKAGTHASTTTSRALAAVGTSSSAIWWRGYNSTIGDIDSDNTLTKPIISFTTGQFSVTGAYHWLSNLDIQGATIAANGLAYMNGVSPFIYRCRFTNTAANSNSTALKIGSSAGNNPLVVACYATATSSATVIASAKVVCFLGCYVTGGAVGITCTSSQTVSNCIIKGTGSHGITTDTGGQFISNTIYNVTGDGIRVSSQTAPSIIANNIFEACTTNGVNSSAGTGAAIWLFNNSYYNCGAQTSGILEANQFGAIVEGVSPFTNAGSNNFVLLGGASSKAGAIPTTFENLSGNVDYEDCGAIQMSFPPAARNLVIQNIGSW